MPLRPLRFVPLFFLFIAGIAFATETDRSGASVVLEWTAPGEDGFDGSALIYDIRYSTRPLTAINFELSTKAFYKQPGPAGSLETCTIQGLAPNDDYYFAVRTMDHHGNWSELSNVAVRQGRGIMTEPATEFAISEARPNPARGRVRFGVIVPHGDRAARIEIFDASGRRVRTFSADGSAGESSQLEWNLTDEHYSPVAAGMYMVRAQLAGKMLLRRFVVVR